MDRLSTTVAFAPFGRLRQDVTAFHQIGSIEVSLVSNNVKIPTIVVRYSNFWEIGNKPARQCKFLDWQTVHARELSLECDRSAARDSGAGELSQFVEGGEPLLSQVRHAIA